MELSSFFLMLPYLPVAGGAGLNMARRCFCTFPVVVGRKIFVDSDELGIDFWDIFMFACCLKSLSAEMSPL